MGTANLPPGKHDYSNLMACWRSGLYDFATVVTAAGDTVPLIGISPDQLKSLERSLAERQYFGVINGSRVVGPRSEQRKLHPALQFTPLVATRRRASASYPEVTGVTIEKLTIKEFGKDSPLTSDLSILLIGRCDRAHEVLVDDAIALEEQFNCLGCTFPIRVYWQLEWTVFRSEAAYVEFCVHNFLLMDDKSIASFSRCVLRQGFRKTYAIVPRDRSAM